ncbi:MAG: DoxX family protein [Acidimicrobiia bacterium]|nr:DoxX family protein [Acidimicrobiia bacterium]
MDVIVIIGRVLYSLIFVGAGSAGHLMQADATAEYAEHRGVPSAKLLTQISGVGMLLGGIGVIVGVFLDLAVLGLVVYTLISAFWVHHFWTDTDDMTKQIEMSMFMKNLSIAGGGLILFAIAASGGDVGPAVTDMLFSL